MTRLLLIAGLSLLGAVTAVVAAPAFPIAADGTTNIADCAKAPAEARNDCISKARPLTGKQLYATFGGASVKAAPAPKALSSKAAAAIEKAKRRAAAKAARLAELRYNKARVASAPKGLKVNGDGTTNIGDCVNVKVSLRDACISRARPLSANALAVFSKQRAAAAAKLAAAEAAKQAKLAAAKPAAVETTTKTKVESKVEAKAAPTSALVSTVKGFVVAKDGTTNVADCAKAKPEFKNECISRARPLTGAQIYGKRAGRF